MGTKYRIFWTLVVLILLTSIYVQNVAALVEEKNLKSLTTDSDDIIVGNVTSKESYWKENNIFTNITISANSHIKGRNDSQFYVQIPGGTVGNVHAEVSDVPTFENNEEVVLFLKGNRIEGWNQGKYTIKDGKIKETGESVTRFINSIRQNLSPYTTSGPNYTTSGSTYTTYDSDKSQNIKNENQNYGTLAIVPHITNITPDFGPAKATELGSGVAASDSTQVTITGYGFGSTKGNVKFWRGGTKDYDATIISWTDTMIVAKAPGQISSYFKPDGTGNVEVFTSLGIPSDNYGNFDVTYSYGGGRWAGNKTVYRVNPNAIGVTDELAAIQAAADTWNSANASFEFVYGGTTSKTDISMDGENSIIWANYDIGAIATTTTWWIETDKKTIVESDIVFNDYAYDWGTDGSPSKMDVQTIATHELGHWLQLLDLYGDIDSKKIMCGYASVGETKRSLNIDDLTGITEIYGLKLTSLDKIAPITNLTGATEGYIYNNEVTITLNATDNIGGSGVKDIGYAINSGKMNIYSNPFIVNNVGNNTVTYQSIDNVGNIENEKNISFTISNISILSYYRELNLYPNIVETKDLLKAADNWRNDIVPSGFSVPLTTVQLLALADEWRVAYTKILKNIKYEQKIDMQICTQKKEDIKWE